MLKLYTILPGSGSSPAAAAAPPPAHALLPAHLLQRFQVVPLHTMPPPAEAAAVFDPRVAAAALVGPSDPGGGGGSNGGEQHAASMLAAIQQLRAASPTLFIALLHPDATEDAPLRWRAFRAGANMVTHPGSSCALSAALGQVASQQQQQVQQQQVQQQQLSGQSSPAAASIACDWCGLPGLSPAEYWMHAPLYHTDEVNIGGTCQICGRHTSNIARHVHDMHPPDGSPPEQRSGVFALCIIRRPADGRFLMTQEYAESGWWVPGGGVDPGESLEEAAVRECWEEAGVRVVLRGVLHVEAHHQGAWRRIIFWGEPSEEDAGRQPCSCSACANRAPKTLPDFESAGACWVGLEQLSSLALRSASEPTTFFAALDSGAVRTLPTYASLDLELVPEWAAIFPRDGEFQCATPA